MLIITQDRAMAVNSALVECFTFRGVDSEIIIARVNAGRFELARCADGAAARREFAAMIRALTGGDVSSRCPARQIQ